MSLIVVKEAREPFRALLFNISRYPMDEFYLWLRKQSGAIQLTASKTPPDRIYQHKDGNICWVVGYNKEGCPAVSFLNGKEGVLVEAEELTDRTEELRTILLG